MAKIRNKLPLTIEWNGVDGREYYLDHLIKTHKWTRGIEVGVRFGRTLFHLLDRNPALIMYAVDMDISQFYDRDVQKRYNDRLFVLEGDSSSQAVKITQPVDFIFIDAGHSTKSVTKDIVAYKDLVKTANGLLGHDIDYPSIQKALNNLNIEYDVCPDNVWQQR